MLKSRLQDSISSTDSAGSDGEEISPSKSRANATAKNAVLNESVDSQDKISLASKHEVHQSIPETNFEASVNRPSPLRLLPWEFIRIGDATVSPTALSTN